MEYSLGQRLQKLHGPVLLTGHTGFKGTWMTFLLEHLGIPVVGYSLPAEKNSLFDRAEQNGKIPEVFADIREYETLEQFIDLHKPSTIIHMAAQPLVLQSYGNPRETFDINVMGTINVLDIAFKKDYIKAIIIVTTDKVYRNDNAGQAFVESDPLEGKDPYSASKVGTESVVAAWQQIAKTSGGPKVTAVRAGNVIGGGDFAHNRLVPDLVRAIISGKKVKIRQPESTRPWQHVIDSLIGYIKVLEYSLDNREIHAFNFAPNDQSLQVQEIVKLFSNVLKSHKKIEVEFIRNLKSKNTKSLEASNLCLNSELSRQVLHWEPVYSQIEAIEETAFWWVKILVDKENPVEISRLQIEKSLSVLQERET
jgi:CDP-glucose 4,6-dehydratase